MPRNKTPVNELGSIHVHGGEFRAHIHFRDDDGKQEKKKYIYMDQVVVLKMKLKKILTKSARLEVSEKPVKKV